MAQVNLQQVFSSFSVFITFLFKFFFLYWKVFSSSQGLKMGRVVGYSILVLVLLNVPSSFLRGYVANMMGNCSLIDFSRLLGVTINWNEEKLYYSMNDLYCVTLWHTRFLFVWKLGLYWPYAILFKTSWWHSTMRTSLDGSKLTFLAIILSGDNVFIFLNFCWMYFSKNTFFT